MDANKLEKLRQVGYRIDGCCCVCVHGHFPTPHSSFGTCGSFRYTHLKHSDSERELSVCRFGRCDGDFTLAPYKIQDMTLYLELFGPDSVDRTPK